MFAFGCVSLLIFTRLFADGANILDLMGCPSHSHHIWHKALVNALAARGHNLTVLSPDREATAPPNVTYLHMDGVYDLLYKEHNIDLIDSLKESSRESIDSLWSYSILACEGALRSLGVQQLLDYPDAFHFDLILYDYASGPCLIGFQHKFNYPPLVAVTAFNNPAYTAEVLGGHNYYAYIPYFSLQSEAVMSFWQRVKNVFLHTYEYIWRHYFFLPTIHDMAVKRFGPDLPFVGDLERKSVLALVNTHPAMDYPEPLPPNVIGVAGLQVRPPQPLPADIEAFLLGARKGAVLFALGSNVRSDQLGVAAQLELLTAFGRMPEYRFLWKFETADLLPADAIPSNVLIRPWLPQNDLLAHPAVRAFFTHAGTLSTHEATWHAVPMVAMPFYFDQLRTSYRSWNDGVAELLRFDQLTAELVETKLRRVLENASYQANMDRRSARFRDQPEHPLQRAVWWVEYVMRDPSAQHMQSPVRYLGPFVANLYDMHALVMVLVCLATLAVCHIWFRMITRRRQAHRDGSDVKKSN